MPIKAKKLNPKYTFDEAKQFFKLDEIKNAELDNKNEPKDEINVIVGDDKQSDKIYPQVKLQRFSNEVNFSIRLIDNETGKEEVKTEGEKIVWEKGNIKIENYDFTEDEGGYKFVWYLKEKPVSNKVEFTIQSKGLDFFYQPELTPEEIAEGSFRPENVVGSYAVYHSTKGGMNDIDGKEYKCGKAFHIYRPHIIDANGAETWGILNIENGIYSVEIPQEFLDTAVYPIKSNDTFGYTSVGGSNSTAIAEDFNNASTRVGIAQTPAGAGTLTSIHVALKTSASSDSSIDTIAFLNIENTGTNSHTQVAEKLVTNNAYTTTAAFKTFTTAGEGFSAVPHIISVAADGADVAAAAVSLLMVADSSQPDHNSYLEAFGFNGFAAAQEDPWTRSGSSTTVMRSIYATYTAAASGPANLKSLNTNLKSNIKSVNTNLIANCKSYNTNI